MLFGRKKKAQRKTTLDVAAIYHPGWHHTDHHNAWYGPGYTEWDLLKKAAPLFDGHLQPKVPSWSQFDGCDPLWAAKEIDLAADHGITAFLFDWYWYSGVQIMQEALEWGFLGAPNNTRMKFAIMWQNHPWRTQPANSGIPGVKRDANRKHPQHEWLPMHHTMEDLDRVVDYCCEYYFSLPNYWTIAGRPLLVMKDLDTFTREIGGTAKAKAAIESMDERARKHGFPGLWFVANLSGSKDNVYGVSYERVPHARAMGFNSVFAYSITRTPSYETLADDAPIVHYEELMRSHLHCWKEIEKNGLKHFPTVTVGSDSSPRWHPGVELPLAYQDLGYEPIVVDNTPEKVGKLLDLAIRQMTSHSPPHIVMLNGWNAWGTGQYLLPEERTGTATLEAIKTVIDGYQ